MKNLISIIIPCKNEVNIEGLLDDISRQTISFSNEVIKITGISPPSKARNTGAKKAKGDILVFIDCDIRLGDKMFLSNLINTLMSEEKIGQVCASIRTPPDSSKFQVRYAQEVPHSESPIVDKVTDVWVASTQCCALLRDVFWQVNGFNENIIRGEDSLLSYELNRIGYRIVIAPNTWCYHPTPESFVKLAMINIRNGEGACFVDIFYPELNIDVHPKSIIYISDKINILQRIRRFIVSILGAIFGMKILLLSARIFYIAGYFFGVYKYKILNIKSQYIKHYETI